MNFGMLWLVFAALLGFLSGWHNYDPTALRLPRQRRLVLR